MGLVIMIRNAFVALDQANATGDYAILWALAAPDFQQRNTPASLTGAFADLRSRNLQLSVINAVDPSLYRPPAIDGDGYLHLAGFFPIDGKQIDFDLTYQTVAARWRLFGMAVHPPKDDSLPPPPPDSKSKTKPKPPPSLDAAGKVPPETRLVALIRGAILGLNQGNLTGNYAVMRESAAAGFQAGNDLPHLAAVFAPLRQRQLDLSPVAVIPPALAKPPTIDKNGFLQLLGYFPSRPEQVSFEMVFALERGEWRLFGIGVESSAAPPPSAAATTAKP